MKYKCHFSNQQQKLNHISEAQSNTFSYGHPKLLIFSFTKRLAKNKETFKRHIFPPRARLQCIYSVWKLLKKSHLSEFEALWKLLLHYLIQFSCLWVEGLQDVLGFHQLPTSFFQNVINIKSFTSLTPTPVIEFFFHMAHCDKILYFVQKFQSLNRI